MQRDSVRVVHARFSLAALFEYVTICAVPLAFSRVVGLASSMLLTAMSLALAFRQGSLAIVLFMAATMAADIEFGSIDSRASYWRQLFVFPLAAALCIWYAARRQTEDGLV